MGCISSKSLRGGSVSARIPQPIGRHLIDDEHQKLRSNGNLDECDSSSKSMPDTAAFSDLTYLMDSLPHDGTVAFEGSTSAGEYIEVFNAKGDAECSVLSLAIAVKNSVQGTGTTPLEFPSLPCSVVPFSVGDPTCLQTVEASPVITNGAVDSPALPSVSPLCASALCQCPTDIRCTFKDGIPARSRSVNAPDLTAVQEKLIEAVDAEPLMQSTALHGSGGEKKASRSQQDYAIVALRSNDFFVHRSFQHPVNRSAASSCRRLRSREESGSFPGIQAPVVVDDRDLA